jgi:hypothetical protein
VGSVSCILTPAQNSVCYVFALEADCDAAIAIINADCATCVTDCGNEGSVFTSKTQRKDGKWFCYKHPDKAVAVDGAAISKTEETFSSLMDESIE